MTDASGVRWTVRLRRLRGAGTPPPLPGPEVESLRRRLAGVLARRPVPTADRRPGGPSPWPLPGDTADVEMRATLAEFHRDPMRTSTEVWALRQLVRMLREAVDHVRTPPSDTWQVELVARGRIRRWARWEVTGQEAATQTAATVAAGVRDGRVPEPWGATLVDVVDQRPLPLPLPRRPVA
ncbi:hypothetical protein [Blastococcus deserti]|uniref:Uncharacterized protein n=1 Tax=Blastococcus deserti TaxID=2259033 RepID=A0ABW4XHS1_9ACTN